jgi:hypothetical protein
VRRTRLTHVAIRFEGVVYSLPAPNRHHHVIRDIAERLGIAYVDARDEDQGFLDQSGRFLNRTDALVSALAFGQVKDPAKIIGGRLYSEDVW